MTKVTPSPMGERVEVGGRQVWIDRAGHGGPAVVFLPGAGSIALDLLLVHQRVTASTSSFLYDRAGAGWSDDVVLPRSAEAVTDELGAVLRAVRVSPPYILVGHSLGGLYAQTYAQRFPDQIAGLVLVEPAHEDWDDYMPEPLKIANQPTGGEMPDLPEAFVARYRSGTAIDPAQAMLVPESLLREQIEGSQRLYDALAASNPRGEHRILDDASHVSLQMVRPDAVVRAVEDVLDRVRGA